MEENQNITYFFVHSVCHLIIWWHYRANAEHWCECNWCEDPNICTPDIKHWPDRGHAGQVADGENVSKVSSPSHITTNIVTSHITPDTPHF